MKLSVIIPVYNVEKYLRECLDSVLSQDFDDYEVLCVEDGSTDSSLEILCEYEAKYPQIKVLKHGQNKGLSAARNTGIKHAVGKYIQFIDSDDFIKPDTFKQLYSTAEENDTDIVYFNLEFLNDVDNGLILEAAKSEEIDGIWTGRELFCMHQKAKVSKVEVVKQFIRREFLLESGIFFREGILHEDILFSFMLIMEAKRIVDYNQSLYVYRQRNDSIMWSRKGEGANSIFVSLINICNYWLAHDFSEEEDGFIADYVGVLYALYQTYRTYQTDDKPVGLNKEKVLYDIIYGRYSSILDFDKQDIERLRNTQKVIVYGAGTLAVEALKLMKKYDVSVQYIAVTDEKNNLSELDGIEVRSIQSLSSHREGIVIIATDKKWYSEILDELHKYGFTNIIIPKFK